MESETLQQKLDALPSKPGVYLMRDREGRVIYVGKAVNLRNRVRQYFQDASSDTRVFVGMLDGMLGDLETMVVHSEKEALLLENELIKKYRPRWNVQLRDDKNFLCLRLDVTHPYPRLETVRAVRSESPRKSSAVTAERGHKKRREVSRNSQVRFFGPYASAHSIRETLRVVNRHFGLRTCTDHVLENRKRPCILYQMGRCPAPCVYPIEHADYARSVDQVVMFLEGRATPLLESLRVRMKDAVSRLAFEEAARLRDQIIAIERSLEKQTVATTDALDQDVIGFAREADRVVVYALFIRGGRMSGGQAFHFHGLESFDDELVLSFVNQYYAQAELVPKEVLLPAFTAERDSDLEALEELLSEERGDKCRVSAPRRGEKAELVRLASGNATRSLSERKRSREELEDVLGRLQQRLHLKKSPRRIECFDVSHHQGKALVASQVAMTEGELDKNRYRRFHVKTVHGNDDFASMYEVLSRRLKRGAADADLPDLIVIDGGKGQLAAAQAAMKDLQLEVDMVGLAKSRDLEVVDRDAESKRSPERLFLVNRADPVVLSQSAPELLMLTHLRDEAHRFAITFQRSTARKQTIFSKLEEIPGVGEGRRRALLRHFGSMKQVQAATIEQLSEVEGLGQVVAERIHGFLHGEAAPTEAEGVDEVRAESIEDAVETAKPAQPPV
ncbi:MAG: excinuclease ABC subunit UvrC [Myxococcaceae bacterium]